MSSRVLASHAGALILVLGLLWSAPASGHSDLLRSSPEEGQQLGAVPARVELVFARPIVEEMGRVELDGPDGVIVAAGLLRTDTELVALFEGAESVGPWAVVYSAVAEDGHLLTGRIEFVVGPTADDERAAPWEVVVLACLGLLVTAAWLLRSRATAAEVPR